MEFSLEETDDFLEAPHVICYASIDRGSDRSRRDWNPRRHYQEHLLRGAKELQLPHAKVVVIEPFQDGVGIHRDGASARRQAFLTGDGWFTYNLLTNVANLQKS